MFRFVGAYLFGGIWRRREGLTVVGLEKGNGFQRGGGGGGMKVRMEVVAREVVRQRWHTVSDERKRRRRKG